MICTFYSYKGGVGRSMALANVGDILARAGLRVLMIDFDLEAPGLEQYFPIDQRAVRSRLGLFDLILRYKSAMALTVGDTQNQEFRRLQEHFITEIYPRRPSGGQLDLMTAGQRGDDEQLSQYALNLRQFDWQDFFFNWGGELFFEWLRRTLDQQLYDVVLVDSRTGVTEMGGICAYQLADVIVVLCAANQQNLEGTHDIVRNFFSPRVRMLRGKHDLSVVVVPARIELQDASLVRDYRERFEALFDGFIPGSLAHAGLKFWDLLIPYEPKYAFQERVLATGEQRSAMRSALQKLVEAIAALADAKNPISSLRPRAEPGPTKSAQPQYDLTSRSAGYDAFLSCASTDVDAVQKIAARLTERGLRVFLDQINPGESFIKSISLALEQSRACVTFVGPGSDYPWRREYQRAEIEAAVGRGLKLVPALLPGAAIPPAADVPLYLADMQWCRIEQFDSPEDLDRLANAITSSNPLRRAAATVAEETPYRGLAAFDEPDAKFFFGRERLTEEIVGKLRSTAFVAVVGPSGSGKTSVVRASIIPALRRGAISGSEGWQFIALRPGADPVAALTQSLAGLFGIDASKSASLLEQNPGALLRMLNQAPGGQRRLLVIDQLEELFIRASGSAQNSFMAAIAEIAATMSDAIAIIVLMRTDYMDRLMQFSSISGLVRNNLTLVYPPSRDELRAMIEAPARIAGLAIEPGLTDLILNDLSDAPAALPLLQYVLERLWQQRRSGYLTVDAYTAMGGVLNALGHEADAFLANHPGSEPVLRRIFTLKLATILEDGEPMRRRAARSEFTEEEWKIVGELADRRNRLLVTDTSESGEAYAEVAHSAMFQSWARLREWIAGEREFLIWRSSLEAAFRRWSAAPPGSSDDALLMGLELAQAERWLRNRAEDLPAANRDFIASSIERQRLSQRRARRIRALVYTLLVGMIVGLVGWINQDLLAKQWRLYTATLPYKVSIRSYVLTEAEERALKPGARFRECASDCPQMIVIPAGSFIMGSSANDPLHDASEQPQHKVTISRPLAVSLYALTFADWDACVAHGGCYRSVSDSGFGRGQQPMINVSWIDASNYVSWLSQVTGKHYRLLSEAEYEYSARAGTETAYYWGNDIGRNNANCNGCGSRWDNKQPAPVGSFSPNNFGLYDMAGNVSEWVEDCSHPDYLGAPTDGSAWLTGGDCRRVIRGGSWGDPPRNLRSASRGSGSMNLLVSVVGLRVARDLAP